MQLARCRFARASTGARGEHAVVQWPACSLAGGAGWMVIIAGAEQSREAEPGRGEDRAIKRI